MKIYSVYNIKGGVGKTTTSVNLAYLSAAAGARTMIWDLDPQGGTSYYLCVKPKVKGGAKSLVGKKPEFDDLLKMTGYPNLDLLPADISYRNLDQYLEKEDKPIHGVQRILRPIRDRYDHVFLDCPPGLTTITENVFKVTDVLLVPLIPTPLSLRAYNRLVQFLVKRRTKKLQVIPFFNMVNPNKPIHRVVTNSVHSKHPIFLSNTIPESTIIEAMGIKRSPIFTYARESQEADSFRGLWKEIQQRGKRIPTNKKAE
ncbi:MAG: ParA family protein [Magnetococcales bacterium]|nr:ParA family protein [Magnetococcales bacterium]